MAGIIAAVEPDFSAWEAIGIMNILHTHKRIVSDYEHYIESFINIDDAGIEEVVEAELKRGKLWPEPLLQFNPSFEIHGHCEDLTREGALHQDIGEIFKGYSLYRHQAEAIRLGASNKKKERHMDIPQFVHAIQLY